MESILVGKYSRQGSIRATPLVERMMYINVSTIVNEKYPLSSRLRQTWY